MKKKPQIFLTISLVILCLIIIVPFILVVSISLSNENDIVDYGYKFVPMNLDLAAYKYVFKNPVSVLNAYKITIIYSVVSMVLSVLVMSMLAFALSRRGLKGRGAMSFYVYFTMLFSGGMVPGYILISQYLHLSDTIWVYIVVGLMSPWYVFMLRTFFQGIPYELSEAAMIDGASEYRIFFQIILPLSKPVLATVALNMFLLKWNDWQTSLLYITDETKFSLQYLLQRIMLNLQIMQQDPSMATYFEETIPAETVRMAMAVVVAGPALFIFPFFQKYFVKGLTVGGVKG